MHFERHEGGKKVDNNRKKAYSLASMQLPLTLHVRNYKNHHPVYTDEEWSRIIVKIVLFLLAHVL